MSCPKEKGCSIKRLERQKKRGWGGGGREDRMENSERRCSHHCTRWAVSTQVKGGRHLNQHQYKVSPREIRTRPLEGDAVM